MMRCTTTCARRLRNERCTCGAVCPGCELHSETCGEDTCCSECPFLAGDDGDVVRSIGAPA